MSEQVYRKQHVVTSVVAVIVDDAERVVLTRRAVPPFRGLWVMPGGKIDLGEPIVEALHREVREEVGIDVVVGGLVDVFEHLTPGPDTDHFVILYYRCRAVTHHLVPNPAEVAEARWVPRAELRAYSVTDGTRNILGAIFPELRDSPLPSPEPRRTGEDWMVRILDAEVNLEYELGHHLHCLVAQIPVRLRLGEHGWTIADRELQWSTLRSVLNFVASPERTPRRLHFVILPESCVPVERFEEVLDLIGDRFRPNTVTAFGLEHVQLRTYRELLVRFRYENDPALALLQRDLDAGDVLDLPVNACCIAVKDAAGRLRVFFEAKSHPFRGEEFLEARRDLYRGRHFWLFRARRSPFNFMVLVCLDYLWRDLYASNVRQIIDRANQLFFTTRQTLDAIFVLQATAKPEHRAYRDVLAGFYGEYLEDTPGVRETATIFGNSSEESAVEGHYGEGSFGVSQVVVGPRHKLARVATSEFSTDDMDGAPLWRLRFGTGTRLYTFNLPLHHELDPRTSRLPLKVHAIHRPAQGGGWSEVSGERLAEELAAAGEAKR